MIAGFLCEVRMNETSLGIGKIRLSLIFLKHITKYCSVADPDPHFFESKYPDPQKNADPDPGV